MHFIHEFLVRMIGRLHSVSMTLNKSQVISQIMKM